jgi:sortase A
MSWHRILSAALLVGAAVFGIRGLTIPAKAVLAEVLLERAWQRARQGDQQPRPWWWADTWPVARLSIPDLDWSTLVLDGASGRELAFAPGRLHGSVPLGTPGTMLIAGHRDTQFAVLEALTVGHLITLEDRFGAVHRYRVQGTEVVDAMNHGISRDADEARLVLMTCWPFGAIDAGGRERYVVWAGVDPPAVRQALWFPGDPQ